MKITISLIIFLVSVSIANAGSRPRGQGEVVNAEVSVCFTPGEDCTSKIVSAIDNARSSIRLQAYGFTSLPIIHALQRAAARQVEVLAILDKINARKYSGATLLLAKGIPVWIDNKPSIAHNKIIVIDGHLTIGGSFNYTRSAQDRNAENVTFIDSAKIAAQYTANWKRRLNASQVFDLPVTLVKRKGAKQ